MLKLGAAEFEADGSGVSLTQLQRGGEELCSEDYGEMEGGSLRAEYPHLEASLHQQISGIASIGDHA